MNVDTISIPKDTAIAKVADLRALKKSQRTQEDEALLSLYSSISKHNARVISLTTAFRQSGLNDRQEPILAIAKGDWPHVHFERVGSTGGIFSDKEVWRQSSNSNQRVRIPIGTFLTPVTDRRLTTQVPYVPANVRPKFNLRNYHILFEVDEWTESMSVDPFLLKHIQGDLYAVVAEWDLTPIEAALLGAMRTGN